jgi:hypothetical protein
MKIQELDGNISDFNLNWDYATNSYHIILFFSDIGDYPFTIYSSSCSNIENITGIFFVREPFNITFCGFDTKTKNKYVNDFAYVTAEPTSSKRFGYSPILETYLIPLGFQYTFKTPVFHAIYNDGCGTIRIFEKNEEYAIRLFDGLMTYESTFSQPNITKSYGTNIFIGKYYFNGSNQDFNLYFDKKDIHQYTYLFNWIYIGLLVLTVLVGMILVFVMPQTPSLSIIFSLVFASSLTLIRIVIWLYWG